MEDQKQDLKPGDKGYTYPGATVEERALQEYLCPVARAKTYLGTPEKEAAWKAKWLDDYYGEV